MQSCGIPLTWFNSANVWSQALFSLSLFALGSASLKHTHSFLIDKKKKRAFMFYLRPKSLVAAPNSGINFPFIKTPGLILN